MNRFHVFVFFCALGVIPARAEEGAVLQPHRAVYDLSLAAGKGRNTLSSATGKISYEFTGSRCEGYSTKIRFLTALQSQGGMSQLSDMTSATFETGDGKELRFVTSEKSNGNLTNAANGIARMQADGKTSVTITKPGKDSFTLSAGILFPAQHSLKLLNTAKSGDNVFRADMYDGSAGGKKVYATTGIIGKNVRDEIPATSPAASLAKMPRYRISLSFFDASPNQAGEQAALYDNFSLMFDNGITYSWRLNYPDFSFDAKLVSLEVLPISVCK